MHAVSALACGVLVAAVAAGAPKQALEALLACATAISFSPLSPSLALLLTSASAKVTLFAVMAAGGALPLVPMQPLALLAGYTFGAAGGAAVTLAGVTAASLTALLTARSFGGGHLLRELLPLGTARPFLAVQLARVARAVASGGLLRNAVAVAALRLRPLAPFSLSNYLAVEAGVRPASLALGTAVGMLPWALLYAAAGAAWRVQVTSGRGLALLSAAADALAHQEHAALVGLGALLALALVLARNGVETSRERSLPPVVV